MSNDTTYNGWANYATWGVALVINNDQGSQEYVRERIEAIREEVDAAINRETLEGEVAVFLKDFTEELCGFGSGLGIEDPSMMAAQLIYAGLSDVDWREIASNMIQESSEVASA
ncbi:MAG TPA: hypothetical protein VMT20_06940 [Terriglobia bacterium]|nr:hypothetical protein [Terriglobia bacterium]